MFKRILVAIICIPLLIIVIFFLPPVVLTVFIAAVSLLASYELLSATGENKVGAVMKIASALSAFVIPMSAWLGWMVPAAALCGFAVMVISFLCAIRAYDEEKNTIGFSQVMLTLFGGALIPVCLSSLIVLHCMENGKFLSALAILVAFMTDGGAYFTGSFLGRHKGVSKVSPNKSLEGYFGGLVIGVASALVYGVIIHFAANLPIRFGAIAVCALVGALLTEVGDLSFSLIKRQYGLKDYGHIIPGHGGILDRFDSMVFCAPVVFFLILLLPVF